jgi:hypothetical protein
VSFGSSGSILANLGTSPCASLLGVVVSDEARRALDSKFALEKNHTQVSSTPTLQLQAHEKFRSQDRSLNPACFQQQQHSLLSQASWGRLEMKPKRDEKQGDT